MIKARKFLLLAVCSAMLSLGSNAQADIIGDAAGDYVAAAGGTTATLTSFPTNWSYLGSTLANGGTETLLTAGNAGNQTGNAGFTGVSTAGTAALQGTETNGGDYELFDNGDANSGVVGRDLLLHSGQIGNADEFVILRYTVPADCLPGTGTINGSFRELVIGGGAAVESVAVSVYQNSTSLFSAVGNQSLANALTEAEGAFSLTGLNMSAGDTIDFVVGPNGHFGADEVAFNAVIEHTPVPEPSSLALLGAGILGMVSRRRR